MPRRRKKKTYGGKYDDYPITFKFSECHRFVTSCLFVDYYTTGIGGWGMGTLD
jgi:hypothetical protein